jgi:hypothetical protein
MICLLWGCEDPAVPSDVRKSQKFPEKSEFAESLVHFDSAVAVHPDLPNRR